MQIYSTCFSIFHSRFRAGTREVHNKLEKERRAQLKECYDQLKKELPMREEDRKKTSNLTILLSALEYVKVRTNSVSVEEQIY